MKSRCDGLKPAVLLLLLVLLLCVYRYVLCARDEGNVARFINHSCDANLYVQPVCSGHTDTDHVDIALVAMRNIPAFTPLR